MYGWGFITLPYSLISSSQVSSWRKSKSLSHVSAWESDVHSVIWQTRPRRTLQGANFQIEGAKLIVKARAGIHSPWFLVLPGPIILGVHVYSWQCLKLQTFLPDSARPYWGPNNSAVGKQPNFWQVRGLEAQRIRNNDSWASQRLPERVLVRAREIREAGPETWTHTRQPKLTWGGKETSSLPLSDSVCLITSALGGWGCSRQTIHHLGVFVLES